MEYNTTRDKLVLPEYGRNVQNMICHAMEIADRDERNRAAQAIIEVMGQLNPHLRDVDDYRHKLWTHLFLMSNFQLDVDSPYEIPKKKEYLKRSMANFMKKQFLVYNNDAVENHVIANQLSELSKKALILENPDDLMSTNSILKSYGIQQNKNNKNKQQQNKKKFKK